MDVITTVPNVTYMCYTKQHEEKEVHNPSGLPDQTMIDHIDNNPSRTIITMLQARLPLCLCSHCQDTEQQGNKQILHII